MRETELGDGMSELASCPLSPARPSIRSDEGTNTPIDTLCSMEACTKVEKCPWLTVTVMYVHKTQMALTYVGRSSSSRKQAHHRRREECCKV